MHYVHAMVEYKSRLKTRDFKVFYRYYALMLREDGVFNFCGTQWVTDARTKKDSRIANPSKVYATLDQNNVLTWLYDNKVGMSERNLYEAMTGFGSATSDTSGYAAYEHKIRFIAQERTVYTTPPTKLPAINVPLVKGLAINVATREIVASTPDVVRSTNRETSKPIIKYVQSVLKTMDVLHRLGDLDDAARKADYYTRRTSLKTAGVTDMSEETMALLAERAYTEALASTSGPKKYEYVDDKTKPISKRWDGEDHYHKVRVDHPEHVWKADHYARVRANAGKRLRAFLKDANGGYDKEIINHEGK